MSAHTPPPWAVDVPEVLDDLAEASLFATVEFTTDCSPVSPLSSAPAPETVAVPDPLAVANSELALMVDENKSMEDSVDVPPPPAEEEPPVPPVATRWFSDTVDPVRVTAPSVL
jgi:hypothetical protein